MLWARLLAYVTGTINQELLLRNEYLAAENRILRGKIKGRLLLSDGEKVTLAEIAHRLGRMALEDVAATAKPNTILGWYRKLIANKFNGSRFRKRVGRPRVAEEIERLVVRMANENPSWGYDRIVGALANLGHPLSDQTVGNILRRHGLSSAPKRKQTVSWKDFIRSHRDVLVGMDFFLGFLLEQPCRQRAQLLGVAAKHPLLKVVLTVDLHVGHNYSQDLFMNIDSRYSVRHSSSWSGAESVLR